MPKLLYTIVETSKYHGSSHQSAMIKQRSFNMTTRFYKKALMWQLVSILFEKHTLRKANLVLYTFLKKITGVVFSGA